MREHFETLEQLEFEDSVREWLEDQFDREIVKLNESKYGIDWAVCKGNDIVALMEFRSRDDSIDLFTNGGPYEPLKFDYAKYQKLCYWGAEFRVPAYMIFHFQDALTRVKVYDGRSLLDKSKRSFFGRSKQRDRYDREPCIDVPSQSIVVMASGAFPYASPLKWGGVKRLPESLPDGRNANHTSGGVVQQVTYQRSAASVLRH